MSAERAAQPAAVFFIPRRRCWRVEHSLGTGRWQRIEGEFAGPDAAKSAAERLGLGRFRLVACESAQASQFGDFK